MGVVLDLTARSVAYVTLMQDVMRQEKEASPSDKELALLLEVPIQEVASQLRDAFSSNERLRERVVELVWTCEKKPDWGMAEDMFILRASRLLSRLHKRRKYIQKQLRIYNTLIRGKDKAILAADDYTFPAPHQWREAIRSLLYNQPKDRVGFTYAIEYLPLLIILAMGGGDYTAKQQRILQEWWLFKGRERSVLTEEERQFCREWRPKGPSVGPEELLVNEDALLRSLRSQEVPLPFEMIFGDELKEIERSRHARHQARCLVYDADPLRFAENMNLRALALSGGGVRSATFNLGILQGLAKAGLLSTFDYMSTVSGGGYIGSWLGAWIQRDGDVFKVIDRLNPDKSRDPQGEEVRPIRWLRMHSNYLTPNTGIMSVDSWTMGLTWFRNTLINQLIILLLFCSVLSLGGLLMYMWLDLERTSSTQLSIVFWCSSVMLILGSALAGWGMHAYNRSIGPPNPFPSEKMPLLSNALMILAVVTAYLISGWLYGKECNTEGCSVFTGRMEVLLPIALTGFAGLLIVAILGRYDDCFPDYKTSYERTLAYVFLIFSSALSASVGLVLLAFVWDLMQLVKGWEFGEPSYYLAFTVGIPLVLEVISLTVVARMALLGRLFPDERREWWGRMGALVHRVSFAWLLVAGAALLSEVLFVHGVIKWSSKLVAVTGGWAVIIGLAVKVAFSSRTSPQHELANRGPSPLDMFVRVAPYLFGLGFLIVASNIVYWLLRYPWLKYSPDEVPPLSWALCLTAVFCSLSLLLTWRVGVNEFSMHHFYRNRLVRAFLGATRRRTNRERTANTFTGFDKLDDLKLADLSGEKYSGPYPIINATLNATQVSDLDRQDRKGEAFVFTPLYCGFDFSRTRALGMSATKSYEYGYRPTHSYAYPGGPAVGTAMAISGAAANPNQGHHSSAATAFLLTAFNVRLGWWMGNPRRSTWKRPDPRLGLAYVVYEMAGKSNSKDNYICLSDGGHFDNMGLYELVRRRCRLIVLGDGEQDSLFTCEGLSNAIRRCRIDFGVEIQIDLTPVTKRDSGTKYSIHHYAIGKIRYPGDPPQGASGTLVYFKSSLTGDEPVDVREYAISNPAFPHQSTGDQFFDESQFESYRRLGLHIVEKALQDSGTRNALL
ncbi:patatin-like phospholipase [Pontibacter ummariensis]|uniref:Patatin-like phospholipase n=1 Tax=Pontibacter ummariensis TaxID=1610492 RepID=A0A239IGB3_9BACT|nr:patatin-like phospholipase family protein [Pontibacter ummariensis]PRY09835.1 patatin-like phospholipase [Pontibacter ummariensis]SNS92601.1 Patatin-like phospholipase [Pontibacter ummariensis]